MAVALTARERGEPGAAGPRPGTVTRHYPVFLDLRGRRCVVVGGGAVAERKVEGLLAAEAVVTVVSPMVTETLHGLAAAGRIRHVARPYRAGDVAGAQLAFVASDDRAVNAEVARDGRAAGVWVNAADDPPCCDFILPAVMRRGGVVVAVGTGGASPAVAAVVRDEIAGGIGEDWAALLEVAADVRAALLVQGRMAPAAVWRQALSDGRLRRLVAEDRREAARAWLHEQVGAAGSAAITSEDRTCG
jgi:siroheme synthase-like protein